MSRRILSLAIKLAIKLDLVGAFLLLRFGRILRLAGGDRRVMSTSRRTMHRTDRAMSEARPLDRVSEDGEP